MSDSTGNNPYGGEPGEPSRQQPPAYPPPQQNPYGQPPTSPPTDQPASQPEPPASQPEQPFGQPAPQQGYGQPQYGQPQYGQPQYGTPAPPSGYGNPTGPDPDKRPTTVTIAAVVTMVLSGITLAILVIGTAALGIARDEVVDQLEGEPGLEGIDPSQIVSVLFVVFGAFIVWCLIAIVLAIFAMRRSNGARIGLVVSSALTAALSLLAITSGTSIITLVAAIAVIVCLFAGGASQWYSRKSGSYGSGPVA